MIVLMQLTAVTMVNVLTFKPLDSRLNNVSVIQDGSEETAQNVRELAQSVHHACRAHRVGAYS